MKTMTKQEALAKYLDVDVDDVGEGYGDNEFKSGREEYLVLTDSEADEMCKQQILDSLWAFNASFILSHSKVDIDEKYITIIQTEKCEDANDFVKSIIKDLDHFVDDAMRSDGRGHFLSGYDGEENTYGGFCIYRTN